MIKWIKRIFLIYIFFTVTSLLYLSFYGLETDYFNNIIQKKINKVNSNAKLKFQKASILLDLKKIELKVKIINPRIDFYNTSTDLNKLNLNISITSLFQNKFALQSGEVGIVKTDIVKVINTANQIKPSPLLFVAGGIF